MPVLFGLTLAVALWSAEQSGDHDVRRLALVLIAVWALMNVAWLLNALWAFPLLDLWAGVVALPIWWTRRTDWSAIFVKTTFVRLELHVLDAMTGHAFLVSYFHALNATFVWMIMAVAFPGGGHVSNRIGRSLRDRFRSLLPAFRTAASA